MRLLFGNITKFGGGYGGLPLHFDPVALLILIHCTYEIGSLTLKWRLRRLSFEQSAKLCIAATMLVWFAYYINRPQPWNLWTYEFLYVFLVADVLSPRLLQRVRRRGILVALLDYRVAALTFVLLPTLLYTNYGIASPTLHGQGSSHAPKTAISGLSMPATAAKDLQTQAEFLITQNPDSTLFFSRHSYSLSLLAGRFNPLPVQDAFAESTANSDFDLLVREIYSNAPRTILFDAPATGSAMPTDAISFYSAGFFGRLKKRLSDRYQPAEATNGWQVWRLRVPAEAALQHDFVHE